MQSLDDHSHAPGMEMLIQAVRYLSREALLKLKSAAEDIHDTRQLAQADDMAAWYVGYVALSVEGEKMVFAEAVEVNVAKDNHLIILLLESGAMDQLFDVLLIPAGEKKKRASDTVGCLLEAGAGGVLTELLEQLFD
jgi:hypothetical protein